MLRLRYDTPPAWAEAVLADLDAFLQDHATNERRVAQAALRMIAHYARDRPPLVHALTELAQEELGHFAQVHALLEARGSKLDQEYPDAYMGAMHALIRKRDRDEYLLDRLLVFGVVEARGCERFRLVAEALPPGDLKAFYTELVRSEARHHGLFTRLARLWFDADTIDARLDAILDAEAEAVRALPIRAALH